MASPATSPSPRPRRGPRSGAPELVQLNHEVISSAIGEVTEKSSPVSSNSLNYIPKAAPKRGRPRKYPNPATLMPPVSSADALRSSGPFPTSVGSSSDNTNGVIDVDRQIALIDDRIDELERAKSVYLKDLRSFGIHHSSLRLKSRDTIDEKFLYSQEGAGAHWDYLLKEMAWMSNDFRVERKWKIQSSRKLVREAERVISKKEQDKKRENANRLSNLRRQAAKVARDVRKTFWNKIDRIVVFKNNTEFLAEQQEMMDRNLDRLLDQTERYTASLVAAASEEAKRKILSSRLTDDEIVDEVRARDQAAIIDIMRRYADDGEVEKTSPFRKRRSQAAKSAGNGGPYSGGINHVSNVANLKPLQVAEEDRLVTAPLTTEQPILSENTEIADGDDSSFSGYDDIDQEDSDMVDDDPEDDGTGDKLAADLDIPVEELLAREYGIQSSLDQEVATELKVDGSTKHVDRKRLKRVVDDTHEPPASSLGHLSKESKLQGNDAGDDDSWEDESGSDEDDEISGADLENPDDFGNDEVLRADLDISIEDLLAREYGISLSDRATTETVAGKLQQSQKSRSDANTVEESDAPMSLQSISSIKSSESLHGNGSRDALMITNGSEEEDGSWRDEADQEDDDIDSEDLENTEDDGGVIGLASDLDIPVEELLAKRYGFNSDSVNEPVNQAQGEILDSYGEDKGAFKHELSSLRFFDEAVTLREEMDDESFEPSDGGEDSLVNDEDTLVAAEGLGEQECTAADLQREAEMPLEDLLRTQYHDVNFAENHQSGEDEEDEDSEALRCKSPNDPQQEFAKNAKNIVPEDISLERAIELSDEVVKNEDIPVPFLLTHDRTLRTYQREGLNWLVSLHDRNLNGILADEMGLGKTAQTIALLAHLAGSRNVWGPHLVVVPTSVILNWDMEFKTWCPGLKVITYFGSTSERAAKRSGWSKPNSFHVCVTSYQLAVQDANVFRRKRWYYIICDEAHALKNSKSQRWQTLLSFQAKRRLLITGTPLQNSLMELWSLMHFLMPEVFRSQQEFRHWFSNPLQAIVEEGDTKNASAVKRLHAVMRPFILRRLKREVATQLPNKYEHIVRLPLARRQRFLYEDFISMSSTQAQLHSGGYMGMMSVLMKLRMVCNHPDLFEPRLVSAALCLEDLVLDVPRIVVGMVLPALEGLPQFSPWIADREFMHNEKNEVLPEHGQLSSHQAWRTARNLIPGHSSMKLVWMDAANHQSIPTPFKTRERIPGVPSHVVQVLSAFHDKRAREILDAKSEAVALVTKSNKRRISWNVPVLGNELVSSLRALGGCGLFQGPRSLFLYDDSLERRLEQLEPILSRFVFVTPVAQARVRWGSVAPQEVVGKERMQTLEISVRSNVSVAQAESALHPVAIRQRINFPDRFLVQYDCGKLQTLAVMLQRLKRGGHRVLIFTQMSRMLDILERFLNLHSLTYFRLDGATKVEDRQSMMDRFNRDSRIFCFILSTRSGGLGINLTGADTVIFYDSDWNPSMDAQAQDRAHRIGQTRDVHIYRLVSEQTIEENILLKSNQKRHLNRLSVEDGRFSSILNQIDLSDEAALGTAEDDADRAAAARAKREEAEMMGQEDEDEDAGHQTSNGGGNASPANEDDNRDKQNEVGEDDEKLEDDQGNVLMTRAQFKELETRLKPVDHYAIDFRTNYFVVVDRFEASRRQKELQRAQLVEEQSREWELTTLEQSKRALEAEVDAEVLGSVAPALDERLAKALLYAARKRLLLERKVRKMTGKCWRQSRERGPGGGGGLTGRIFYINQDTSESTWERPRILNAEVDRQKARTLGWTMLQEPVLARVSSFLSAEDALISMALACRHWWRSVAGNSQLCTLVDSESYVEGDELLMVGTRVEARFKGGEAWFAGTVVDTHRDGAVGVLYTDGELEKRVRRPMVRHDRGGRVTLVRRDKTGPLFEFNNLTLASKFGCGTPPLEPLVVASLVSIAPLSSPENVLLSDPTTQSSFYMTNSNNRGHLSKDVLQVSSSPHQPVPIDQYGSTHTEAQANGPVAGTAMDSVQLGQPSGENDKFDVLNRLGSPNPDRDTMRSQFVLRPGLHYSPLATLGGPALCVHGEAHWVLNKGVRRLALERVLPDDDVSSGKALPMSFDESIIDIFDPLRASVIIPPPGKPILVDGGSFIGLKFAERVVVASSKQDTGCGNIYFRHCDFENSLIVASPCVSLHLEQCRFKSTVNLTRGAVIVDAPIASLRVRGTDFAQAQAGIFFNAPAPDILHVERSNFSLCSLGPVFGQVNAKMIHTIRNENSVFVTWAGPRVHPLWSVALPTDGSGKKKAAKYSLASSHDASESLQVSGIQTTTGALDASSSNQNDTIVSKKKRGRRPAIEVGTTLSDPPIKRTRGPSIGPSVVRAVLEQIVNQVSCASEEVLESLGLEISSLNG